MKKNLIFSIGVLSLLCGFILYIFILCNITELVFNDDKLNLYSGISIVFFGIGGLCIYYAKTK